MYSGYVNITQEDWLFYWCVEIWLMPKSSADIRLS
jgi:hypothetical protein